MLDGVFVFFVGIVFWIFLLSSERSFFLKFVIEIGVVCFDNFEFMKEWVQYVEKFGVDLVFLVEVWWSDFVIFFVYLVDKMQCICLVIGIMQVIV